VKTDEQLIDEVEQALEGPDLQVRQDNADPTLYHIKMRLKHPLTHIVLPASLAEEAKHDPR
jgi:hypothetical protein